ncbi:MAG TPA: hypothetical protein VMM38_07000 [Aridibacter sp.]|nr:hypothetical protein [Aridibacter sp.]
MDKSNRSSLYKWSVLAALAGVLFVLGSANATRAQSNDPNFPTPVVGNEVSGTIQARAIGDPRLTTYYFIFNGNRGDVFINILTTNFKGEIDIYTAQGLNPRTKITIYADNPERETGRVVYQRQPERLILRIQGRTPNDDPATYQVKFAGSFAPITGAEAENTNEFPDILGEPSGGVKVSPTGAIIPEEKKEEVPAAEPDVPEEPAEIIADAEEVVAAEEIADAELADAEAVDDTPPPVDPPAEPEKRVVQAVEADAPPSEKLENPRVIVTDPLAEIEDKPREVTVDLTGDREDEEVSAVVTVERVPADDEEETAADDADAAAEKKDPAADEADPLARVFLKVELKDGTRIERRMTEVVSVNVVNGMLTIVTTDGLTREIPILSVLKMTIEQ